MLKLLPLFLAATLWCTSGAQSQVPGAFPHLVLTDGAGTTVPGAGGPFDNSGVFPAFSGMSFEAQVTYQAVAQPNNNVLWGLLVSVSKTPLPTNVTPPPLLTMPPFLLLLPTPPNLSAGGFAKLPLYVPAGVYSAQTYVQGLVFDVTSAPNLRLTNGLTVTVDVPEFSVNLAFVRSKPAGGDGQLRDLGVIDIDAETLNTLKPIGTQAPPTAVPDPAPLVDDYRFLPILPNAGDEPVNPRARPMTRINGSVTATATTIAVDDTSFFPTRGRLMISFGNPSSNLWKQKDNGGLQAPEVEVVTYDGTTPTSFLNCQRTQLGSKGPPTFAHTDDQVVLGFFTMATASGARLRDRVSLDADNRDMPHVVIPPFTFDAGGDLGVVTRDLDLYMYETLANQLQGFMLFDRVTSTWTPIPGTEKNALQGRWNPIVAIAPDGRSMIAHLQIPGGIFGWDNLADGLFAIRLDGLNWPATGSPVWMIPYQTDPDPASVFINNVRSRRLWMPATAIIGSDPENYVAYVGLAHKWQFSSAAPGSGLTADVGFEAEYVNEEIIVRDMVECPLVPPGSSKSLPSMPRPYITAAFGNTGLGNAIARFDPDVQPINNNTQLVLAAGSGEQQEDVFVIRNVVITQAGGVTRTIANISGYNDSAFSAGESLVRAFAPGGHGQGSKLAVSPNGLRAVWVTRDKKNQGAQRRDWLNTGLVSGASFGKVKHIYANATDAFKEAGPLVDDRAISGVRFLDNTRIMFMMGNNRYDDPLGLTTAANAPAMDLFVYDITADVMTNVTKTSGSGSGFNAFGKIAPAAYFASPNGDYAYLLRAGGIGSEQQSNNPALILPSGTAVTNVLGLNMATLDVFPVTGTEIDGSSLIGNLTVASGELFAPVETAAALRFTEAEGVQEGLLYFSAHRAAGNGADDVFALNRDIPFVTFAATAATKPGVHVSNLAADPHSAKLAFARTDTTDPYAASQHPYVVDLDNFLFERDLMPTFASGGVALGRLMDGSFHFIAPSGSAGDALVFSFGLTSLTGGIAGVATPAYYPLAAVSDLLAEPIPVLIPLVDTFLLGTDFRFYVPAAGPSPGN
jgi:hypothetical protein